MKYLWNTYKKRFLCCFLIILLLSAFLYPTLSACRFQAFLTELFRTEMEANTLTMHYVLAHPEDYGVSPQKPTLPVYSEERKRSEYIHAIRNLHTLQKFRAGVWDKDSRFLYTLLENNLQARIKSQEFYYYSEPLSPFSGVQCQLPILLAEYTFRNEQDVIDYLLLLEQVPSYFRGIISFERKKAAQGLFMPDISVDKVTAQCKQIMDPQSIANGAHFLDTSFRERITDLYTDQLLSQSKADFYIEKNHTLLEKAILPAYQNLSVFLPTLKGKGKNEKGLACLPGGKEYYLFLLAQTTGSSRSIKEIKEMLTEQLKKDISSLSLLAGKDPEFFSSPTESFPFPLRTSEDMLAHLRKKSAGDFPAIPDHDKVLPGYVVKNVSKNMEKYCSSAFYLTSPVDDVTKNSIYINQKNCPQDLELYTTLAHEGFPGHLYQTVYFHKYCLMNHIPPVRALLSCGGYVEGWAYYVEMLSYEYAVQTIKEKGASRQDLARYEAERLNRNIQLCLYTFLDIAIHYEGASFSDVQRMLSGFGIHDSQAASAIYEYIRDEPATYPKYFIGYLEFLALKNTLKDHWGDAYSDRRFHQAVLECGPAPFSVLTEYIKKYDR